MNRMTTIELFKENMKFSSGHYTIFSATKREKLHGHNFTVYVAITAELNEIGMPFDYDIYKEKVRALCKSLTQYFLIAGQSPYQRLEEEGDYLYVYFAEEKIPFLKKDVIILPLKNITVEELARWFTEKLTCDSKELKEFKIQNVLTKVYSGPGQCGSASWQLNTSDLQGF